MTAIIIGLAASFNFLIILKKIRMERYEDAGLDFLALILLSWMFGGTLGGMMIATIASATISISLLTQPTQFNWDTDDDEEEESGLVIPTLTKLK